MRMYLFYRTGQCLYLSCGPDTRLPKEALVIDGAPEVFGRFDTTSVHNVNRPVHIELLHKALHGFSPELSCWCFICLICH